MTHDRLEDRLGALIGKRFMYQGLEWILIDVLIDEQAVILRRAGEPDTPHLQADQYGRPQRYTAETISIALYDESGADYSAELMDLFADRIRTDPN